MASRLRRRREGAGKRARRLSSQALASKLASGYSEVATARAHLPGSSDGDGEADVEPATKTWMASQRPKSGWQRKAIIGPKYEQSESFASQQRRLKYLGHTVGMCYTNMREPLAKQSPSKSSSNNVIDKKIL